MEAPSWRHRSTNDIYHKSVAAVVVAAVVVASVDDSMASGCMLAVTFPEEVDEAEEGGGAADEVRQ